MRWMLASFLLACGGAPATAETSGPDHAAGHPGAHRVGGHGHHGQGAHHDFSDTERFAAIFDADDRDAWQRPDEVVEHLAITPGATVVDLGAGTGYFLPHLSRAVGPGGCVVALDVEPAMVEHMQRRIAAEGLTNVVALLASPGDPGLPDGAAQRVLIVDTWHHIEAREAYAERLLRALAPGGGVMVVDFTREAPRGPPPAMRLPARAVRDELRAAGFIGSVVEETLPHQYIVVGARPGSASDAPPSASPCAAARD